MACQVLRWDGTVSLQGAGRHNNFVDVCLLTMISVVVAIREEAISSHGRGAPYADGQLYSLAA